MAAPVQIDAFLHDDHRGLDVAGHAGRALELDALGGRHIARDLPVHDHVAGAHRAVDAPALTHDEGVARLELAPQPAIEHHRAGAQVAALDLRALIEEGAQIAAKRRTRMSGFEPHAAHKEQGRYQRSKAGVSRPNRLLYQLLAVRAHPRNQEGDGRRLRRADRIDTGGVGDGTGAASVAGYRVSPGLAQMARSEAHSACPRAGRRGGGAPWASRVRRAIRSAAPGWLER